jgi:hypothetical protein
MTAIKLTVEEQVKGVIAHPHNFKHCVFDLP